MKFSETLEQARDLLQRKGRLSYRTLKLEFDLSEEQLEALKEELIEVQELAVDKDGKMLVWIGEGQNGELAKWRNGEGAVAISPLLPHSAHRTSQSFPTSTHLPAGERRQLTVLFCDMVGFTELANRVDPEVLQGIIRRYEDACAVCITRYEGYVYQRL